MAYVDKKMKFVLTNYGKEQILKKGVTKTIKYFTLSDDGVNYTLDFEPDNLLDVSGSHESSTNLNSVNKNIIKK